jgi:hypothetical protein
MSNDDLDLDSVLFGGSDPPGDGSFDPFLPGLGESQREDDSNDGDIDTAVIYDGTNSFGRSDRSSGEGDSGFTQDDDRPFPGARRTVEQAVGIAEQREREAADAGDRHLRRVAEQRGGSAGTGTPRRESSEGVANSIADAQQRIKLRAVDPLTPADERTLAIAAERQGPGVGKPKREYQKRIVSSPPQFQETEFEATLMGFKSNVAGNWILQLVIPPMDAAAVIDLKDAYGLALKVTVTRKRYDNGAT